MIFKEFLAQKMLTLSVLVEENIILYMYVTILCMDNFEQDLNQDKSF